MINDHELGLSHRDARQGTPPRGCPGNLRRGYPRSRQPLHRVCPPAVLLETDGCGPSGEFGKEFGKERDATELQILHLLSKHPEMTEAELAREIGLTKRTIEKRVARLQKAKKLVRTGGRKMGQWKVMK